MRFGEENASGLDVNQDGLAHSSGYLDETLERDNLHDGNDSGAGGTGGGGVTAVLL